jgi:hypothetical protein
VRDDTIGRRIWIALFVGLALVAGSVGIALSSSPVVVAATNGTAERQSLGSTVSGLTACQEGETLPRNTSAVRLSLFASVGSAVAVRVLSGGRVLTSGEHGPAWTGGSVTVPIRALPRAVSDATTCFTIRRSRTSVSLAGASTPRSQAARLPEGGLLPGRLRVEYLRQSGSDWWSMVLPIARRMGLGRALAGTWVAPFVILLMLVLTALVGLLVVRTFSPSDSADTEQRRGGSRLVPRQGWGGWRVSALQVWGGWRIALVQGGGGSGVAVLERRGGARVVAPKRRGGSRVAAPKRRGGSRAAVPQRRGGSRVGELQRAARSHLRALVRQVPRAAWLCALVACLNAVAWSFVSPPFQTPDEPSHFAYVQLLAETGRLPDANYEDGSPEENLVLSVLRVQQSSLMPFDHPVSTEEQQRELESAMASGASREGAGGAGPASSEPPLFYALETIPYEIASGGSLLDQLQLMRLMSALMAAITAMFAYLFVREALPRSPWAWTVGGLAVALFPLLGVMSGAVNPDAMLFAVCATLYYCLARGFRRGLTNRLALAIGILTCVGFLTKLNFIGFAPGVLLGLVLLAVRARRRPAERAQLSLRAICGSLAIAISPVLVDLAFSQLSNHSALGSVSGTVSTARQSFFHELSYIWQFYLPRLPGMPTYFPGILTPRLFWFNGLVGLYGWDIIPFPNWVYNVALVVGCVIAVLALRELIRRRGALRRRVPELLVYGVTAIGVMAMVGTQSFVADAIDGRETYWEPRYLLPMLALWGLVATLAARGAGKRWGPVVGVLLVTAFLGHDIVSQLQVVGRFYG